MWYPRVDRPSGKGKAPYQLDASGLGLSYSARSELPPAVAVNFPFFLVWKSMLSAHLCLLLDFLTYFMYLLLVQSFSGELCYFSYLLDSIDFVTGST